jgi:hypothetical protein
MANSFSRPVALAGAGAVIGFDAVASLLSEPLGFRYEDVFWISLLLYVTVGFIAGRQLGSPWAAARTSALVGLADATLGWGVSYLIQPDLYSYVDDPTLPLVCLVVALVVVVAAVLGGLGGIAGKRFSFASTGVAG